MPVSQKPRKQRPRVRPKRELTNTFPSLWSATLLANEGAPSPENTGALQRLAFVAFAVAHMVGNAKVKAWAAEAFCLAGDEPSWMRHAGMAPLAMRYADMRPGEAVERRAIALLNRTQLKPEIMWRVMQSMKSEEA